MNLCASASILSPKMSQSERLRSKSPRSREESRVDFPKAPTQKSTSHPEVSETSPRPKVSSIGKLSGSISHPRYTPSISNIIHITPRASNVRKEVENYNANERLSPTFDIEKTVSNPNSPPAPESLLAKADANKTDKDIRNAASAPVSALPTFDYAKKDRIQGHSFDFKIPSYHKKGAITVNLNSRNLNNGRRSSLDSLMNAVQTVSDDQLAPLRNSIIDKNNAYQTKMARLIEIKNKTSNLIKSWPLTQAGQGLHHHESIACLLDDVSLESVKSLSELSELQALITKEILVLKKERDVDILGRRSSLGSGSWSTSEASSHTKAFYPTTAAVPNPTGTLQTFGTYKFPRIGGSESSGSQTILPPISVNLMTQKDSGGGVDGGNDYGLGLRAPIQTHRAAFSDSMIQLMQAAATSNVTRKSSTPQIGRIEKSRQTHSMAMTPGVSAKKSVEKPLSDSSRKNSYGTMECVHCTRKDTPEWRRGPYGNRTVCNACGLFYGKLIRKFGVQKANIIMHYRKSTLPEDRRVPSTFFVPESFIRELQTQTQQHLNADFSVAR